MRINKRWLAGICCNAVVFLLAATAAPLSFHGHIRAIQDSPKFLQVAYLASSTSAVKWSFARTVLMGNIRLLFVLLASTVTFGLAGIIQMCANGIRVGLLFANVPKPLYGLVLVGVLPHGIMEYTAFFACGGKAVEAFFILVDYVHGKSVNLIRFGASVGFVTLFSATLLTVAAFVEAFITPKLVVFIYGK